MLPRRCLWRCINISHQLNELPSFLWVGFTPSLEGNNRKNRFPGAGWGGNAASDWNVEILPDFPACQSALWTQTQAYNINSLSEFPDWGPAILKREFRLRSVLCLYQFPACQTMLGHRLARLFNGTNQFLKINLSLTDMCICIHIELCVYIGLFWRTLSDNSS